MLRNRSSDTPCKFDGDDEAIHFGYFDGNEIVGIVSFYWRNHSDLGIENALQLRGMATSETHRGRGVGSELLKFAIAYFENRATVIWCNARESAIEFYRKQGFESRGEKFEIPEIGMHIVMVKML